MLIVLTVLTVVVLIIGILIYGALRAYCIVTDAIDYVSRFRLFISQS